MLIPAGAAIQAHAAVIQAEAAELSSALDASAMNPSVTKIKVKKASAKNANGYDEGNSYAWEDIEYDDDPWEIGRASCRERV